ncbi:MAG TPA: hypothetical protein PK762_11620 [Candidatus Kapabacteria bacterium]|nr:hypothetical protein [Candidatus Kapabacteria bacterium]
MKKMLFYIALLLSLSFNVWSQQNQQQAVILKPVFVLEDVNFAVNVLNSIEITGTEVEVFLNCKNTLISYIQSAQKRNKTAKDTIHCELALTTAQSIANFLDRAKFSASQAEQFKRFIDALVESTKNYKSN